MKHNERESHLLPHEVTDESVSAGIQTQEDRMQMPKNNSKDKSLIIITSVPNKNKGKKDSEGKKKCIIL